MENYENYYDLISNFGIGLVLFPSLVYGLNGSYLISTIEAQEEKEEVKEGDQDHAHPSTSSKSKIKIAYKIPFRNAEHSHRIASPYIPLNKTKIQKET